MSENYVKVCGEIIGGLSPRAQKKVQVIGGLSASAMADPHTAIDPRARVIEAPADLYMSTIRDNGTVRDLDLLVSTIDQGEINAIEQEVKQLGGGRVVTSAFGLKSADILDRQKKHPIVASAKTWVGDRYFDPESSKLYRALFPFAMEVPLETLAPYTLVVGDSEIPVAAPAGTVLNYTQRSIGGLRPKDRAKFIGMLEHLRKQVPDIDEEIHGGIFREQAQLTVLIDSLRQESDLPKGSQLLGLRRPSAEEILQHQGFMLQGVVDEHHSLAQAVLKIARFKASVVGAYEGSPALVSVWQNHIEPKIDGILKNK